jgi:hypothetical protein
MIYPALHRWFAMQTPEREYEGRLPPEELTCLSHGLRFRPKVVHELAAEMAAQLVSLARAELLELDPAGRRVKLRQAWADVLGDVEPASHLSVLSLEECRLGGVDAERIVLEVEPGIVVPLLLLPPGDAREPRMAAEGERKHVVLGVAQQGGVTFLKSRAQEVAQLLGNGIAVCLPDLRGTGETATDDARGLRIVPSEATVISPAELMLGQTMVGSRLRDLRAVLRYLRERWNAQPLSVAIWGEGFAPINSADFEDPPWNRDVEVHRSEPMGALLALLAALFEEGIVAVAARRGLVGFASMLASPFFYVPHDVIVPGVLRTGDISDLAAALMPLPLRLESLVDGRNRAVMQPELDRWLAPAFEAYADHADRLRITTSSCGDDGVAAWLTAALG